MTKVKFLFIPSKVDTLTHYDGMKELLRTLVRDIDWYNRLNNCLDRKFCDE